MFPTSCDAPFPSYVDFGEFFRKKTAKLHRRAKSQRKNVLEMNNCIPKGEKNVPEELRRTVSELRRDCDLSSVPGVQLCLKTKRVEQTIPQPSLRDGDLSSGPRVRLCTIRNAIRPGTPGHAR